MNLDMEKNVNFNIIYMFLLKKYISFGLKKLTSSSNGIPWTTPTPWNLGDYLLGVYFKIFLKYFEQSF
jgi:hypothetical protein